jgi:hypothetical protein
MIIDACKKDMYVSISIHIRHIYYIQTNFKYLRGDLSMYYAYRHVPFSYG